MPYVPTGGGGSVAIGGTVTSATAGSVFFAGALGVLAQNNAAFQWDNTNGQLILKQQTNYVAPLAVRQSDTQNPHGWMLDFQASNGTSIGQINAFEGKINPTNGVWLWETYAQNGGSVTIDPTTASANPFKVTSLQATSVPILINLAAAQSADAFQVKDSGAVDVFVVNPAGSPGIKVNAAPADGDIDANQLFWWFDSTNGAAKAKFKGKSANGTVVSGEIALA